MATKNINSKIYKFISANPEIDGIVITDPANLAYVTGLNCQSLSSIRNLKVLAFFSEKKRFLACPKIMAAAYQRAGWHDSILAYANNMDPEEAVVSISAAFISELFGGKTASIGYMADLIPQTLYEKLTRHLPDFNFTDITADFSNLRQIKNNYEKDILITAATYTDHGIAGSVHHVARNVPKTEKFLTEDIRVHAIERGLPVTGYRAVSQAVSEEAATQLWPNAPYYAVGRDGNFFEGKFIRLEMCGMMKGYWSNDSRMMVKSDMNSNQKAFSEKMTELRKYACSVIRPGAVAKDVFKAIDEKALALGLNMARDFGYGHGIGVEPVEAPYISAADETILQKDMVLILNLAARYTIGGGELYITKDTLVLNDEGCEIVGWYENWDYPYTAAYTF